MCAGDHRGSLGRCSSLPSSALRCARTRLPKIISGWPALHRCRRGGAGLAPLRRPAWRRDQPSRCAMPDRHRGSEAAKRTGHDRRKRHRDQGRRPVQQCIRDLDAAGTRQAALAVFSPGMRHKRLDQTRREGQGRDARWPGAPRREAAAAGWAAAQSTVFPAPDRRAPRPWHQRPWHRPGLSMLPEVKARDGDVDGRLVTPLTSKTTRNEVSDAPAVKHAGIAAIVGDEPVRREVAHCHRGRCGRTAWLREPAGCLAITNRQRRPLGVMQAQWRRGDSRAKAASGGLLSSSVPSPQADTPPK